MSYSAQGSHTVRRRPKDGEGVTLVRSSVRYASSTSGTSKPTSWGEEGVIPDVAAGLFLWIRTYTLYSDGNEVNVYSVSRMGKDGFGVKTTETKYYVSSSKVSPESIAESSWGSFPSSENQKVGYWLYTRTKTIFTDNDHSYSYSVVEIGTGAYYAGMTEYYALGGSYTTPPSNYPSEANPNIVTPWSASRPSAIDAEKPYLWNVSVSYDSRGNAYYAMPVCIGNHARGIKMVHSEYGISKYDDVDTAIKDITKWDDEPHVMKPTNDKPYQWNRTYTEYNDGTSTVVKYNITAILGANARLDLDNDNDIMVVDGKGVSVSGDIVSHATLYVNGVAEENVTFSVLKAVGVSGGYSLKGNTLTVTKMAANEGYVDVGATYRGVSYGSRLTLKRIQGTDKCWLKVSPNAVNINSSTGAIDHKDVSVEVWRTDNTGASSKVTALSDYGLQLWVHPNGYDTDKAQLTLKDGKATIAVNTLLDSVEVMLLRKRIADTDYIQEDAETVLYTKVKDGEDGGQGDKGDPGDPACALIIDKPIVTCIVDGDATNGKVLKKVEIDVLASLYRGSERLALTVLNSTCEVSGNTNYSTTEYSSSFAGGNVKVSITVPAEQTYARRMSTITVKAKYGDKAEATGIIQFVYIPRGITGDMGKTGAMPVPWGTYSEDVKYYRTKDSDGAYIDTPIVWQEDGGADGKGAYYALMADSSKGYKPSNNTSNGMWRAFTMMEYVFAKVVMAQFGQFGKSVMWGDYFFSQRGINASGVEQDYDRDMFGDDGRLNGTVIPNLFLDLRTGAASMRKLSELFESFSLYMDGATTTDDMYKYIHKMDMNRSHNVSVFPRSVNCAINGDVEVCGAVVMPQYGDGEGEWKEDGSHATVVYQFEPNRGDSNSSFRPTNHPFVAVCADARMFNEAEYDGVNTETGTHYYPNDKLMDRVNCFIWKGWPVKWILLSQGASLKVRSVKQYKEVVDVDSLEVTREAVGLNWVVENAADFEAIDIDIAMQNSKYGKDVQGRPTWDSTLLGTIEYRKPTDTNSVLPLVLGGGVYTVDNVPTSVFDETSVFVDIGDGMYYDIGAGAANVIPYVRVGLTERRDDQF